VNTTTLTPELVSRAKNLAEMQSIRTWSDCVRVLAVFVFDVLQAIAEVFAWTESARILMVDDPS
jgi:hypothetical protein